MSDLLSQRAYQVGVLSILVPSAIQQLEAGYPELAMEHLRKAAAVIIDATVFDRPAKEILA